MNSYGLLRSCKKIRIFRFLWAFFSSSIKFCLLRSGSSLPRSFLHAVWDRSLYTLQKRTENSKHEDHSWLGVDWYCREISNSLKLRERQRSRRSGFIWTNSVLLVIIFRLIFSFCCYPIALASAQRIIFEILHDIVQRHIECLMTDRPVQQHTIPEQMVNWYLTAHLSKIHFWRKVTFSFCSQKYKNKSKKSENFTASQNTVGVHLIQFWDWLKQYSGQETKIRSPMYRLYIGALGIRISTLK